MGHPYPQFWIRFVLLGYLEGIKLIMIRHQLLSHFIKVAFRIDILKAIPSKSHLRQYF